MNQWQQFLQQQGANFTGEQQVVFTECASDYPQLLNGGNLLFALEHMGSLCLNSGALDDGNHKLLQGQVTCDMASLNEQHTLFGAHCTPKGRAIANFQLLRNRPEQTELIMPNDLLDTTKASLSKFAPFFKVTMAQGQRTLLGIAGADAITLCCKAIGAAPEAIGQSVHCNGNSAIQLDSHRVLLLVTAEHRESIWNTLAEQAIPTATELWNLLTIRAGLGQLNASTTEQFVPQMLNMQASHGKNGAINFKKGCYTGQEVVARMHYLGKLKRRMYHLQITGTAPASGDSCYLPDKQQSQGTVVSAAHSEQNHVELLAVLTEQAANNPQLIFGSTPESAQQQEITLLPLPYSLDK